MQRDDRLGPQSAPSPNNGEIILLHIAMDHLINWTLLQLAPISYDSYCSAGRIGHNSKTKEALDRIYNMNTINGNIVFKTELPNRIIISPLDWLCLQPPSPGIFHKNTEEQVGDITVNLSAQFCLEKIQFLAWTTMNHYCEPLNWNNNFGNSPASPDKWDKLYSVSTGRQAVWTQTSDLAWQGRQGRWVEGRGGEGWGEGGGEIIS